jgi:SAM-dependent methyltransferase
MRANLASLRGPPVHTNRDRICLWSADQMSQFDELASLYEEMAELPWRKDLEIPTVLGLLGDLTGAAVLDIGCGSGLYTRRMRSRGARRVVGIDESEGMVAYAKAREQQERLGIEYLVGPLPASERGAFDLVLGVYVLPYASTLGELHALCTLAHEALRPGGRLVTLPVHPDYVNDSDYYARYGFRLYSEHPRQDAAPMTLTLRFGRHDVTVIARYWTRSTLENVLRTAGFRDVDWRGYTMDPAVATERGADFWRNYLTAPHAAILDCRK